MSLSDLSRATYGTGHSSIWTDQTSAVQANSAWPYTQPTKANPLKDIDDADLVMEMLTRGFIVQKMVDEQVVGG